ncbi:hypothetical protein [Halosegnis rubeus]|uniref:hypothetical protein n=1 Tax=Halosegnis rubeus TaxID=2212850 RepID=UPI001869A67C|nr:hypothetical protein [Halosegnis rubeus]
MNPQAAYVSNRLGRCGEVWFDGVVAVPAAECHHDSRRCRLLDEQVVRPAAPEVVRRHLSVVIVAGLLGSSLRGLLNPPLHRPLLAVDQRLGLIKAPLVVVAVEVPLQVGCEPRLPVLAALKLASSVFALGDGEEVVFAVLAPVVSS